jgi:CRP-like cAMP-binding protein
MPPAAPAVNIASLRRVAPIGDGALAALERITSSRSFNARDWLLEAGARAERSFLITSGLVREFYIGESGAEHTRVFVKEGQLTGSLYDLLSDQPSITWIQAIEDTRTLTFTYRDFIALRGQHPELHVLGRVVAEALYVRKIRREHEMLALTAAERYARWIAAEPDLDRRVERRHVASYLGITPEHLSRLRRRPSSRSSTR